MPTIEEFENLLADLTLHVDVLIQHSENYYVMCREATNREADGSGRTFNLIRRAVGHEIVARLYRLIEDIPDGTHFSLMMELLSEDQLLGQMMGSFNHDGRKSLADLKALRDEVIQLFESARKSDYFAKTEIYRHRFVGHRIPQPRKLKKLSPNADVTTLSSAELRWLTDSLSNILDKVSYMVNRGGFPASEIAQIAEDDSHQLWGLEPPKRPNAIDYLLGKNK